MNKEEIQNKIEQVAYDGATDGCNQYVIEREAEKLAKDLVKLFAIPDVINWVAVIDNIPNPKEKVLCYNGYRMIETSWEHYTNHNEKWFRNNFTYWTRDVKPPCL